MGKFRYVSQLGDFSFESIILFEFGVYKKKPATIADHGGNQLSLYNKNMAKNTGNVKN